MTLYKRPSLTSAQTELVASILKAHLTSIDVDSADFDEIYRAYTQVRDSTILWELHRLVAKAVDPGTDDDTTQMLGYYKTLDEADLAKDYYEKLYPGSRFFIQ